MGPWESGKWGFFNHIENRRRPTKIFTTKSLVDATLFTPLGYQCPIDFYSPYYPTVESRYTNIPDHRITIFWNPHIFLNKKGQATIEFYSSDAYEDYYITIEGVSQDGKIIHVSQ